MPTEPPIDDEDSIIRRVAAVRPSIPEDDLSPDGPRARAIRERVLAGAPVPSRRSRRDWARPRWTPPWLVLAAAPVAAAAIVLFLAGTFSGPDSSGTQPAAAAVIRAAERALSTSPGTISVEDQTFVSGPTVHGHPYTLHTVQETPAGRGPQNYLDSTGGDPAAFAGARRPLVSGTLYLGGTEEIYSPTTHTVYASSIWGPYLHPGRRPGTYIYRSAPGATVTTTRPVNVTARQRRALLTGHDAVMETSRTIGGKVYLEGLKVRPVLRGPAQLAESLQGELRDHNLHVVGRTTVDGRDASEVAGRTTDATAPELHLYFDPSTHLPFKEVDSVGTRRQQVIDLHFRTLPITRATQRLLSLQALHPTARFDRSHRDYVWAAHGLQVYNQ